MTKKVRYPVRCPSCGHLFDFRAPASRNLNRGKVSCPQCKKKAQICDDGGSVFLMHSVEQSEDQKVEVASSKSKERNSRGLKWSLAVVFLSATVVAGIALLPDNHLSENSYDTNESLLRVQPEPSDAQIRIMNIKPKFDQNMILEPGRYDIEVSKPGYKTSRKWIEVGQGVFTYQVVLEPEYGSVVASNSNAAEIYKRGVTKAEEEKYGRGKVNPIPENMAFHVKYVQGLKERYEALEN
ncbi:hypothetical protein [Neptuniibacter halophilus]|uniref:hypothetical protein n=1 Tax=Neptuniibacter halophilus TaxID=651666 RepID=UPI002573864C|nr:hypothetical protein [Neptuniibacter halophilus]